MSSEWVHPTAFTHPTTTKKRCSLHCCVLPIPQIRLGSSKETRGTAYIVYEDIYDAKEACEHLSGFNVANRYLIVLYFNPAKHSRKIGTKEQVGGQCGVRIVL